MKNLNFMRNLSYLALIGIIYNFVFPQYAWAANLEFSSSLLNESESLIVLDPPAIYSLTLPVIQQTALLSTDSIGANNIKIAATKYMVITAYSSTPDQTDASPFITASGAHVRDGIIAANIFPFGTLVKMPKLYGDKIFVVEDRLAPKNGHKIDVWFPSRESAMQFGVKITEIQILR